MGDLVCLTPIINAVKSSQPDRQLYLFARSPFVDILSNNPHIDRVMTFKSDSQLHTWSWLLKAWSNLLGSQVVNYFNFTASFEASVFGLWVSPQHRYLATFNDGMVNTARDRLSQRVFLPFYCIREFKYDKRIKEFYLQWLSELGFQPTSDKNQLFFPGHLDEADKFISENDLKEKKLIGISVASGKDYKQWPGEKWVELIDLLKESAKIQVVLFGSEKEREHIEYVSRQVRQPVLSVIGKSIPVLPYYLKKCSLFVSVDSGLCYISDALGVPVVNIMGPVDEVQQRPENNYKMVNNRDACRRILKTPPISVLSPEDAEDIKSCYNSITPAMVLEACSELL